LAAGINQEQDYMKPVLAFFLIPLFLSACALMQRSTASQPPSPSSTFTEIMDESIPPSETLTIRFESSPTDTPVFTPTPSPTQKPTETAHHSATPLPPTLSPTPFLPSELHLISPENIADLQKIAEIPVKEIYQLAVSPAGNYVATLSEHWEDRSRYMQVWDLNSGAQVYQQENMDIPWGLFFLPDETSLAVLFPKDEPQIRMYDLSSGEIVRTLNIPLNVAALSPDGELFAAGSIAKDGESSSIIFYDFATGQESAQLNSVGQVMVLSFSPDGKQLVAGLQTNNNFRLKIWDVASLALITELVNYSSPVYTLQGNLAASQREGKIYLFDPGGWLLRGSFDNMDEYGSGKPRSFSFDGKILIGSDTYSTVFWEPETGQEIFELPNYGDGLFSPSGKFVLTWCYQCSLAVWGVTPE
jgi:WD40 repeat protein